MKPAPAAALTNGGAISDCWKKIGVWGRGDCPELEKYVHCRSCPVYSAVAARLLDAAAPAEYLREWTAYFSGVKQTAEAGQESVVVFRIGSEWLGLPTRVFQEIGENRPIHSLPHRNNPVVLGLVNSRGELLICASLAELLGLGATTARAPVPVTGRAIYERLLVVSRDGHRFVFPVDEVQGIHRYALSAVRDVPQTVAKAPTFTRHLLPFDGKLIACLNDEILFQALNRGLE
jgi:chemotaxis-related protein WspD